MIKIDPTKIEVVEKCCIVKTCLRIGRRKKRQMEEEETVSQIPGLWDIPEVVKATELDPCLKKLLNWSTLPTKDEISGEDQEVKFYWRTRSNWYVDSNGLIWYKWFIDGERHRWKLVIPRTLQENVLKAVHNAPTGGHFGEKRSFHSLLNLPVFWFNFKKDMQSHCRACDDCLRCKPELRKTRSPMSSCIVGEPLQRMAIDIVGPLHTSKNGNCYIAVIMDYFTKWVALLPLPNHTAETIAKSLVENVFTKIGLPKYLHSDQGRDFCSKLFCQTCLLFGIDKTTTTPWRPQSDGMVERMNRTLGTLLRCYVNQNQDNWDEILPICAMAYNSSVHSSTGFSPHFLMFGREMRLPLNLVLPSPEWESDVLENEDSIDSFVRQMEKTFHDVFIINREHLQTSLNGQKHSYDKKTNELCFKPGDGVWLYNPRRRKGRTPKLDSPWDGPFTVIRTIGQVLCQISKNRRCKPKIVHKDKLLHVRGKHDGSWVHTLPKTTAVEDKLDGLQRLFEEPQQAEISFENVDISPIVPRGKERDSYDGPVTRSRAKQLMGT